MKINLDRLCKLAGVDSTQKTLNESSNRSMHEDPALAGDADFRFGQGQLSEADEKELEEEEEDLEEMIEVDEAMLVQEIRRAKKMLAESAKMKSNKNSLKEAQLRKAIAEEVENVFKELNLTSGWVYGKNTPKNRAKGTVNTAFPGIGFKK